MSSKILLRRGTAAQWSSSNPILGVGELGIETDTLKIKIGNGTSTWTQLTSYANVTPSQLTSEINNLINAAPSTLDTLNELAAAINNDASFSTTVNNLLTGKVSKSGGDTITPSTTSTIGLTLASPVGQTANLLYAAGGTRIPAGGNYLVTPGLTVSYVSDFNAGAANITPIYVKGAASQTANLQEWQNSAGSVIAKVDANGSGTFTGSASTNAISAYAGTGGSFAFQGFNSSNALTSIIYGSGEIYSASNIYIRGAANYGASINVITPSTSTQAIIVRGRASQTANLQEWQDSAGTILARVSSGGAIVTSNVGVFGSQSNTPNAQLYVLSNSIIYPTFVVKAIASQTANLQEWQRSNGLTDLLVTNFGAIISGGGTTIASNPTINAYGAAMVINSGVNTYPMLILKGAASQTANLQEWQDSAGIVNARVRPDGQIGVGSTLITGTNFFVNNTISTTNVVATIRGAASQTANLQEWQNTAGTMLASIDYRGYFSLPNGVIQSYYFAPVGSGTSILTLNPNQQIFLGSGPISANGSTSAYTVYIANSTAPTSNPIGGGAFYVESGALKYRGTSNAAQQIIGADGSVSFVSPTAATVGLIVRGAASQTANLQEWQNSEGTSLVSVSASGDIFSSSRIIGFRYGRFGNDISYTDDAPLRVTSNGASTVVSIIKGATSQSADLQQWQNSSASVLAKVDSLGNITATDYKLSNSLYSIKKTLKKTIDPAQNAIAGNTYDLFQIAFSSSLQGIFTMQVSIRNGGYGQSMSYTLPVTYVMDWLAQYGITNPFTDSTTWVDLTPITFAPRHLMTNDYLKFQARVSNNTIFFRIKLTGQLTLNPLFDVYIQHSEEFANSTITELSSTGTDFTTSGVLPNFLSSKAGATSIFNPVTITSSLASTVPLKIKSATSQTANLQEWQNSAGTVLANIYSNGTAGLYGLEVFTGGAQITGNYANTDTLQVNINGAARRGILVKGAASQTANLQEWQNSAGTILGEVVYTGQYVNRTQIYADNTQSGSSALVAKTNYGSVTPFVVQGAPDAQTADLQKWITHSGTVLAKITGSGALDVTAITVNGAALAGYSAPTIGSTSIASGATVTTLAGLTSVSSTSFVGALTGNASTVTNGVYTNAANIITAASSTTIPIIAKAAASQTADLQQWQNSAGDVISAINSSGFFAGNSVNLANFGQLYQVGLTANQVPVVVSGATSQTADLQEWRSNQSSAAVAKIDVNGNFKGGLVYDIKDQTGTSYTFVLSDSKAVVTLSNANNITASVPTNSTAFPIGSSITVIQYGQGQVTIQALTPGTTTIISNAVTPAAPRLRGILSSATLIKVSAEGWIVIGDIY